MRHIVARDQFSSSSTSAKVMSSQQSIQLHIMTQLQLTMHCLFFQTPLDHPDVLSLGEAMVIVEDIIAEVDRETGIAKCKFTREKLVYLDDKQVCE